MMTTTYAAVKLAALSENQIIAKEFKYHRSCDKEIVRKSVNTGDDENDQKEYKLRNKCFEDLKLIVQEQIIENNIINRNVWSNTGTSWFSKSRSTKPAPKK